MDNDFMNISIRGRATYCISCLENALLHYGYDFQEWKFVLEHLWNFMNVKYVDNWFYQTADIVSEFLLEDIEYDEEEFELIDEKKFHELYELYNCTNEIIKDFIKLIFDLVSVELYGRIQGYSEGTIVIVEKVIQLCKKENIQLPDIADYKKYRFSINDGWGEDFEGRKLSKILSNI